MECLTEEIKNLYPPESYIIGGSGTTKENHTICIRLKCTNKEEFLDWLKEHQTLSGVTFRVLTTKPRHGITVNYKAVFRCQHNTHPSSHKVKTPSKKHTNCEAKLTVTIKTSVERRRVRSKDKLRSEYPTIVKACHVHNHLVDDVEFLRYKDPSDEVRTKFLHMFRCHHGPVQTLQLHKQHLLQEYEDDYAKVTADRSLCPDLPWVYRLYYTFKRESVDGCDGGKEEFKVDCDELTQSSTDGRLFASVFRSGLNDEELRDGDLAFMAQTDVDRLTSLSDTPSADAADKAKVLVKLEGGGVFKRTPLHRRTSCENEPKDPPTWEDMRTKLHEIVERLRIGFENDPESFAAAISRLHSSITSLKMESSILSELDKFGKSNCAPLKAKKRELMIPAQPTSLVRRKSDVEYFMIDVPAKKKIMSEHDYCKRDLVLFGENDGAGVLQADIAPTTYTIKIESDDCLRMALS